MRRHLNRIHPRQVRRVIGPLQAFIRTEVSGGLVLMAAAIAALAWANSPWDGAYNDLFTSHITLDAGIFRIEEDFRHWINDGLMTLFFYVVGLEIKRELVGGELSGRDRALLPIAAAAGGMIAPAVIYAAINAGGDAGRGWGIPMATDIAFALGVLALLGKRIPSQLRIFLLALAIADDVGAILVIAVFYSSDVQIDSLLIAAGFLAAIFLLQRFRVRFFALYVVAALGSWVAVYDSGVHATIAGVALGLLTPLVGTAESDHPLERLETVLHPTTSFLIVPLFALANAGLSLDPDTVRDSITEPVTIGVALGLILGKPLGIVTFAWVAVRARLTSLPSSVTWLHMIGAGMLAGIGFTVALFIDELAFGGRAVTTDGKLGILCGSLIAGALGYALLRLTTRALPEPAAVTGK